MKKYIVLIVFTFFSAIMSFGQNNDYFGSVIIPKNEYLIKVAGTNFYLSINHGSQEVLFVEKNSQHAEKLMFIPAGNGFYHIKLQSNGRYLSITDGKMSNGSLLQAAEPARNEAQKFRVIEKGRGQFRFVTINNLVFERSNGNKLSIAVENGEGKQIFEILEAKTMEKFSAN